MLETQFLFSFIVGLLVLPIAILSFIRARKNPQNFSPTSYWIIVVLYSLTVFGEIIASLTHPIHLIALALWAIALYFDIRVLITVRKNTQTERARITLPSTTHMPARDSLAYDAELREAEAEVERFLDAEKDFAHKTLKL